MRQTTVVLLVILAATALVAWFLSTHYKVVDEEYVGYRGEARYNSFLAAELFLKEAEIEADSVSSLTPTDWLPDYSDTIISRATESIAIGDENLELFEWVSGGGHLVLLPPAENSETVDRLFESFGASLVETISDTDESGTDQDAAADDAEEEEFDYYLDLNATYERIELQQPDSFSATLSDDEGNIAVRRSWGNGYITLIADDDYFLNSTLEDYDHARFLLDVVAGYLEPGKVWFVLDAAFPSLWQLLWKNGFYLVVASAIAIFLWLWSVIPRFGPAITSESAARRSILEHVGAAGHFAWRHRGTVTLATSSIEALIHDAETKHPGISRLSPDAQAVQLSNLSGIPAQRILDVLMNRSESRHREFTHNIQDLQKVRNRL